MQVVCTGEEFSIDVFCDLDNRCLNAIPRTMIESKGGESIKGMSIKAPDLIELGRDVAESLPLVGPANVQCFREPDGRLLITDVNLGGGMDGVALAEEAQRRWPGICVVVMTGDERNLGRLPEALRASCFVKPFNPPRLVDAVRDKMGLAA